MKTYKFTCSTNFLLAKEQMSKLRKNLFNSASIVMKSLINKKYGGEILNKMADDACEKYLKEQLLPIYDGQNEMQVLFVEKDVDTLANLIKKDDLRYIKQEKDDLRYIKQEKEL